MAMQTVGAKEELRRAAKSRRLMEVTKLDYRRALKHLAGAVPQVEIARTLGITQPTLSSNLKTARTVPEAVPGFSGAGPYEICQRFAADLIEREQLVDELTRWEYTPIPEGEWFEDPMPSPGPGSWREVVNAVDEGLIDDATYDEVLRASVAHADRGEAPRSHA